MPKGRKKDPMARQTFIHLWSWLMGNCFSHMLEWTDVQNREFSILFMNKRNREWTEKYLELFKALDNISPKKAARYRQSPDYDKDCKKRCRSNLQKLCKDKILKQLGIEEIKESIKKYHYRFLEVPSGYPEKKNVQLNVKKYDSQVERSVKVPLSGEICLPEREDSTNFHNYNFSHAMGGGSSSLSSIGMTSDENLLHEVDGSICSNNAVLELQNAVLRSNHRPQKEIDLIQMIESGKDFNKIETGTKYFKKLEACMRRLVPSLGCNEEMPIPPFAVQVKNNNYIQPMENNISSSDRWSGENLLCEAEDSFSLNNIPNYLDAPTIDWNECSELVKYTEEEIPSFNDKAVRQSLHLIKDEDPLWSAEYNQMEPSVPSLF